MKVVKSIASRRVAVAAVAGMVACATTGAVFAGSGSAQPTAKAALSASAGLAYAKSHLEKGAPTSVGVTQPLKKRPTGKVVDYVSCNAPLCVTVGKDMQKAGKALGLKVNVVNGGSTPESITAAFNKVVQDKADGVVSMNYTPQQWNPQFKALCKRHAVILLNNVNPEVKDPCVTGYVFNSKDAVHTGTQVAYKIIVDSKGKGDIVYINSSDLGPGAKFGLDVWNSTLKKYCPGCKSTVLNVATTDVGNGLPGKLVSFLQAHPTVKYVRAYYGDMFIGVPAALKAAGLKGIKLYSSGGGKAQWQAIKDGDQVADYTLFLNAYGYQLADMMARGTTGQKFTVPPFPLGWITKSNVNFDFSKGEPPFKLDYVKYFKTLWAGKKP